MLCSRDSLKALSASFSVTRVLTLFLLIGITANASSTPSPPPRLSPAKDVVSQGQWVEVTADTVVRKLPRAKSDVIADLDRGTLLQLVRKSKNGQWLLVKDEESHSGWIPLMSTNLGPAPASSPQKRPELESPKDIAPSASGDLDNNAAEESEDADLKLVRDSHSTGLVWRGTLSARYTHQGRFDYPLSLGVGFSKQSWSVQSRRLEENSNWLGAVYKHDWNSAWGLALMGLYRESSSSWESGVDLGFMDKESQWRWDFGFSSLYRPQGRPVYWVGRLGVLSGPWEWNASVGLGVAL